MKSAKYLKLREGLGYGFKNIKLLEEALRHSSYVNENPGEEWNDNERFEFLGDAVLNLVIGHLLMIRFPNVKEGDLSRMRASLVNETQLSEMARLISLGKFIKLGKGEVQSNGNDKSSILADAYEAIVAAIYLDGGYNAAYDFINDKFSKALSEISIADSHSDFKSQLQELVQSANRSMPHYKVVEMKGPDHDKTFKVKLTVYGMTTYGVGKSRKKAEQQAANNALKVIKKSKTSKNKTHLPVS